MEIENHAQESVQSSSQASGRPAKSKNLLIFFALTVLIIILGITGFVYQKLSGYQPSPAPWAECVEKSSLNCAEEPELSFECTEEYQDWARANCPGWQGVVYCSDPRPEVCTTECIENPPYICGSDAKSYCSVCQACSDQEVAWYKTKASPCTEGGQFCGGIAGVECPDGYFCEYDGNYPDASGVCVKTAEEILPISGPELSRGWYYSAEYQKKPDTPASWIYTEAGKISCWHEPGSPCPNFPPD